MNPEAKEELKRILEKAKTDPLEDYELDFLRARKDYLKKSQLESFGYLLEVTESEEKKREKKEQEKIEADEINADELNRTAHPAEKKDQIPYKILQNEAKKLGKRYVGVSRKDLEESLKK